MSRRLPPDVLEFLYRHISSVETLKILLLLHANPERSFTTEEAAIEVGTSPEKSWDVVASLVYKGFLAFDTKRYRYQPRDAELDRLVVAFAREYMQNPAVVLFEIAALGEARTFANSFRFRKRPKRNDA